jgi:hypothetical protein
VFDSQDRVARSIFCAIAREMKVEFSPMELLQGKLSPDEISSSFLHLFRYNNSRNSESEKTRLPCEAHTDRFVNEITCKNFY